MTGRTEHLEQENWDKTTIAGPARMGQPWQYSWTGQLGQVNLSVQAKSWKFLHFWRIEGVSKKYSSKT
jgi:hypothetical protein